MSIEIPADLQPFVREQISLGCFQSEQQLVTEALQLLKAERDESLEGIRKGLADVAAGRVQSPLWHPDEFPAWAESKRQFRGPADWRARAIPGIVDWRETVAAIGVPALLLRGGSSERGAIVSAEIAAEAQRLNSRVQTACFAQAGHNVRREAFAPYVAAVSSFLARY